MPAQSRLWLDTRSSTAFGSFPKASLKGVEEATLKLADGSTAGLTLHTFDGTIPAAAALARSQPRRVLRSAARAPTTKTSRRSATDAARRSSRQPTQPRCSSRRRSRWVSGWRRRRLAVGVHHRRGLARSRSPASSASAPSSWRAARGRRWGGFLNATFGNAAELIIALVALQQRPRRARQGLDHRQHRRQPAAGARRCRSSSAAWAGARRSSIARGATTPRRCCSSRVVALVMPAVFDLVALRHARRASPPAIDRLSFWSAIVLIVAYAGSLIYAFTAQRDLFRSTPRRRARRAAAADRRRRRRARRRHAADDGAGGAPGRRAGAGARRASGSPSCSSASSSSRIIGNAAEHYSAVTAARRDEMTLAVEIAVGSSAQIALLVAPALVLYSFAIGRPMSLLFNAFEIAAIALSVLATVDRGRRRREQLGRRAAAAVGLSHPRAGLLFRPRPRLERRVDAIMRSRMGDLSDRLIAELVDAVRGAAPQGSRRPAARRLPHRRHREGHRARLHRAAARARQRQRPADHALHQQRRRQRHRRPRHPRRRSATSSAAASRSRSSCRAWRTRWARSCCRRPATGGGSRSRIRGS
mgnify:CR=1 FL=1